MLHSTKRFLLIFYSLLMLFVTNAIGQTTYNLPAVIQPSPQSQAFTRYGDYPMSDYTGLSDITIPIHSITGRKLSMPITMSFHASGRMANEPNGLLGMRWTLNCGGLVTRTVKGTPDEWGYLTPYVVNPNNVPSFDELYSACPDNKIPYNGKPVYDTEFDLFSYVLPNGKQGHFILKNQNGVLVPMLMPYSPLKIEMVAGTSGNAYLYQVKITDIDGTKYYFGKLDASTESAIEYTPEWDKQGGMLGMIPTGWYLTKIVSIDGTDEISLSYTARTTFYDEATQSASISDQLRDETENFILEDCDLDPYECNLIHYISPYHFEHTDVINNIWNQTVPTLSGVQFSGGSVSFNYTTVTGNYNSMLLNEMVISRGSVPYKTVKFNTSKHAGEADIWYLDSLSFYGEDANVVNEIYGFSYYDPYNPMSSIATSAMYRDWWGYACPPAGNLLPAQTVGLSSDNLSYPTLDIGFEVHRDGDENYKKFGMLKTITYPTGGETEFAYEGNRYDIGNSATGEGPGLRIKEVISKPGNGGKNIHKIYKYGENEDGKGFIDENLRPGWYMRTNLTATQGNMIHFWDLVRDVGGGGQPILWTTPEQAGWRTRDYFSDPYIRYDFPGSPIKYDVVREYYLEDETQPRQKTESRYLWINPDPLKDFNVTDHLQFIYNPRKYSDPQNAWQTPVLESKSFYKYSNGQFDLIKKESYTYDTVNMDEAWDMPTYLHTNVVYARSDGDSYKYEAMKQYHNQNCSVYGYGFRRYVSGAQNLAEIKTEEFTPTGAITVVKDKTYERKCNFVRSEVVLNSKNEQLTTNYSYPKDLTAVSPYDEMVNRNIISPVIEQVQTNTTLNKELARSKTNYSFWQANTLIQPITIQKSILGNALETEATIDKYDDKGNILQVTGKDGVITSYLWGYDQKYPVAKIFGRTYDDAIALINITTVNDGSLPDETIRTELNKLRALSNCLVSTYTYKPLTGMTSETDPDSRTIYYEYDMVGRLVLTRDKDNNILKKYAYDYLGQCTTCGAMSSSNWQATGITRHKPCEVNAAFNGRYGQREEKDLSPASPTYNQSRWIDYYIPSYDPLYEASLHVVNEQYWVNTSTSPRCIQVSGQNTGEQEHEQVYLDPNPCHEAENGLRWKNTGMNTSACPLPAFFKNSEINQNFYSSVCISPAEPDPIPVFVAVGTFTSALSVDDANGKAWQSAQTYADQHGTCTVPPVMLNFMNNTGDGFTITLSDATTSQEYTLHAVNGSNAYYQNLPQGIYHIYISPSNSDDWLGYQVGCDVFTGTQGDVYLYDIPINANCNTITVNYY